MAKGMIIWKDLPTTKAKMKIYTVEAGDSTMLEEGDIVDVANWNNQGETQFVSATVSDKTGYFGLFETPMVQPAAPNPAPPPGTIKGQIVIKNPGPGNGGKILSNNTNPKIWYAYAYNSNYVEGDCVYFTLNAGIANIQGKLNF
ncbi:MAG TPA: hypothetical protein VNJ07_13550 [Chitinophagales bacterium]|nr:hypothetical protein [Chitinophagales bacterium]